MGNSDPGVDVCIRESAPFARPLLKEIRETGHAACPDVEDVKQAAVLVKSPAEGPRIP